MLNNPVVKIDGAKFLTTESGDIVPLVSTGEELVLTGSADDLAEGKTLMGPDGVVTGTHVCTTLEEMTSDADATANDILSGKTAYVNGTKVIGTIPTKTASDMTVDGATIIVPAGNYESEQSKSVATATQATPTISVDSAGKITASATQAEGYVAVGTKSATKQLTTQAAKTVTPSTNNQTAVASGVYTTGDVVVAGDANLVPENIVSGVSIFGVAGNLESIGFKEVGTITISINRTESDETWTGSTIKASTVTVKEKDILLQIGNTTGLPTGLIGFHNGTRIIYANLMAGATSSGEKTFVVYRSTI